MRSFDNAFAFPRDEDLDEEAASFQRLLAALVESRELEVETDPVLDERAWEAGEDLLERRLTTV